MPRPDVAGRIPRAGSALRLYAYGDEEDRVARQGVLAALGGPSGIGLPGAVDRFAAARLDRQGSALEAEQLVLERIAGDPLADGRAEGAGGEELELSASKARVITEEGVVRFVNGASGTKVQESSSKYRTTNHCPGAASAMRTRENDSASSASSGRMVRSFQRHQTSCFGLSPSRAANSSAQSPLLVHRCTRFAHSARVAMVTSSLTIRRGSRGARGGHDGHGRVATLVRLSA
jgi:hypothetical protein